MILAQRRAGRRQARPRARLSGWLPATPTGRELLVAAGRPRALIIKLLFPLALAVPLLAGHAPAFWASSLLCVLVAMVGAVGSAVAIARAGQSGLLVRLALVPRPAWRTLGGWMLGGTVLDGAQILPVLALAALSGGAGPARLGTLIIAALTCLVAASTVGCIVAALGGGVGEVLLDVTVVLAPLLYLGGLFTGVPRTGWRQAAALIDPFGQLHAAFLNALGGAGAFTPATIAGASGVVLVVAVGGLAVLSRWVLERGR